MNNIKEKIQEIKDGLNETRLDEKWQEEKNALTKFLMQKMADFAKTKGLVPVGMKKIKAMVKAL